MYNLTPEQQFEEHLLNSTVSPQMYKWPSCIGNCRRQLAYAYHKFSFLPVKLESAKAMLEGTGIHIALTNELLRSGLYKYREKPKFQWNIDENTQIPIKVDGIIEYLNKDMVFEAKSVSGNSFNNIMIKGELDNTYYMQVQLYMAALDLNFAFMFLWNKGYDPNERGFKGRLLGKLIIPRDPAIVDEVKQRYMTITNSTPDKLPDRDIPLQPNGKLQYKCKSCRFVQHCYPKQYEDEKKGTLNVI